MKSEYIEPLLKLNCKYTLREDLVQQILGTANKPSKLFSYSVTVTSAMLLYTITVCLAIWILKQASAHPTFKKIDGVLEQNGQV